ncbi:MAG TPA: succinylglutamate desuccinylase/aspartoacylase family protein [Candidatus Saccharimonadales bacterium]|nr:succinylglutamate desuccinylase/aspartoacylase family protein [Candidatus Saccharimonadales bacterium]
MKILVLGGTHGNEPLGLRLVAELKKRPIADIDAIVANPRAAARNTRGTQADLNRSFPGNSKSDVYEQRRAARLLQRCGRYDLVLDFHNTLCDNNDCVFIGQGANEQLLKVAGLLDLTRVIVADYDCINKYAPNCISLEISVSSHLMSLAFWRQALLRLAKTDELLPAQKLNFYRYALTLTNQQRDEFGLTAEALLPFRPFTQTLAAKLGVPTPAYPIFIGKNYTEGVFAGVLTKLTPDIPAAP